MQPADHGVFTDGVMALCSVLTELSMLLFALAFWRRCGGMNLWTALALCYLAPQALLVTYYAILVHQGIGPSLYFPVSIQFLRAGLLGLYAFVVVEQLVLYVVLGPLVERRRNETR